MRSCERLGFFRCAFFFENFFGRFFVHTESTGVGGSYMHMYLSGDDLHFACC